MVLTSLQQQMPVCGVNTGMRASDVQTTVLPIEHLI
jgi:hypothetical protein